MTSRAHWKFLIAALLTSGCQSTGSMMPWFSSKDPVYSSDQLALLDSPRPIAAGAELAPSSSAPLTAAKPTQKPSLIQQVSGTMPGVPVAAGKVDELVRLGQARIREAGQNDPIKLQQARDVLSQALALDGSNTAAHHSLAIVADLQKDWQTAEIHYKQALQARPQDPSLLNDIGYSYLLQNRYHEATQYLNQTLQLAPQHERAHVNLALLSLKSGDRVGAQNRLSAIYSPADTQTTLARLEKDTREAGGSAMAPVANNAPVNGAPMGLPQPFVTPAPYQQSPAGMRPRQPYATNVPANAQPELPVHVYPPGIELSEDQPQLNAPSTQFYSQNPGPGMNTPQMQMQPQMPYPQVNGAQAGTSQYNSNGSHPQAASSYLPQPNQFGNVPYSTTQPGYGPPVYSASQNQVAPQQGLLQQMAPSQQPATYPTNTGPGYPAGMNAPLAGLNAGPGALFPISADVAQTANYGISAGQQNQTTPQQAMNVPGTRYPAGNNVLPAEQQMHQMQMRDSANQPQQSYQPGMYPASSTQYPVPGNQFGAPGVGNPQAAAGSQFSAQAPQALQYVGAAPATNTATPSGASARPLAAYEQQLRNLDSQYNRTLQQMDGRGTALGASPGQYR